MPEFMYHYGFEGRMMSCSQCVGVIDATTTVFCCIGNDNDMLVRNACQGIVYGFYTACGEITVRVKRIEMRTESGVATDGPSLRTRANWNALVMLC